MQQSIVADIYEAVPIRLLIIQYGFSQNINDHIIL